MRSGLLIVTIMLLGIAACEIPLGPEHSDLRELSAGEQTLVQNSNAFGFGLLSALHEDEAESGIFISPISLSMALGMALNGAQGETLSQMIETLDLAGLSESEINSSFQSLIEFLYDLDPQVIANIANSIWYRDTFEVEQEFLNKNVEHFDAEIQPLDFDSAEAADIINAWVEDKTEGMINQIVDGPVDPLTVVYLVNAVYFYGTWTYAFDPDHTQDDTFTLLDGSETTVPMMSVHADFRYFGDREVQVIDLPYGDGQYSMTVVLPHDERSVNDLIETLDEERWAYWTEGLSEIPVDLYMPRFRFEYTKSLAGILQQLGMTDAFDPGVSDFSNINPEYEDLYISDVLHKTFVDVDEEGTEAAAVTALEFRVTSANGPSALTMRIDRPFFFTIREHHSGAIMFMGKMVNPQDG